MGFAIEDIIKIKNPETNWQSELRYTVLKVKKTVIWCCENNNPKCAYKGVKKSLMIKVN